MTNPKISIIIPCYNSEKWIEKCVNSALKQTYENIEVIVVDNESKDNSLEIINKLKKINPLLIVSTAPNLYRHSWTEPVEEGLSLSSGEYFTIVGSDDCLDEKYIENIADIIKRSSGKIEIFQSPIRGIDAKGLPVNEGNISHSYKNLSEFKEKLFTGCPVNTPSVVYKKSAHDEGYIFWDSESFLGASDYNLYFHLADKKKFIYPIPKWLGYYYRWHPEQSTWGMQKEETRYDEKIKDYWRKKWHQ
jgi:glycosyltransferase involved in cell wall biosynthesis